MPTPISTSPLGDVPSSSSESGYVSQLGRISGKLLSANLLRNGVDLTFRNGPLDNDLLYLDVNNLKIGINTDTPSFELTVSNWTTDSLLVTNNLRVTDQTVIDDFIIYANNITTQTNEIDIYMTGSDPTAYFDRLSSNGSVVFDDNKISGNGIDSIEFDPSLTGTIELLSTTNVDGDVNITGNISVDGNLSTISNVIIGDHPMDTVTINTDLTQDIVPGTALTYDLGAVNKRWAEAHSPNWTSITNLIPSSALVSEQTYIGGPTNLITTVQSNEDLLLQPGVGFLYVDQNFKLETVLSPSVSNDITNLSTTEPVSLGSTGNGYTRFVGTNAMVIPAGTSAERGFTEIGETRWNTEEGYLECYDGNVYIVSTGPGETVTQDIMTELAIVRSLILG